MLNVNIIYLITFSRVTFSKVIPPMPSGDHMGLLCDGMENQGKQDISIIYIYRERETKIETETFSMRRTCVRIIKS